MHKHHFLTSFTVWAVFYTLGLLVPDRVSAHGDSLDGPVVQAAGKALETGEVNLALIWVQKQDEGDINEAFRKTLAVRTVSAEAGELAERYFFETLVRLHRAGGCHHRGRANARGVFMPGQSTRPGSRHHAEEEP